MSVNDTVLTTDNTFYQSQRVCPSGGIGRHKGFKIPRLIGVPVQVRPRVPLFSLRICSEPQRKLGLFCIDIHSTSVLHLFEPRGL